MDPLFSTDGHKGRDHKRKPLYIVCKLLSCLMESDCIELRPSSIFTQPKKVTSHNRKRKSWSVVVLS